MKKKQKGGAIVNDGQLGIYDFVVDSSRPCAYRFKRYIGQRVRFWRSGITGTVKEIKPYYTYVETDDGKLLVGSPYELAEVIKK
jgi:hypothetical protein